MGFIILASLILPILTMQKRLARSPRRAFFDSSAVHELDFVLMLCSMFFVFAGLYIPFFYIKAFAKSGMISGGSDSHAKKYLIVFMNTGSFFGRLVCCFSLS